MWLFRITSPKRELKLATNNLTCVYFTNPWGTIHLPWVWTLTSNDKTKSFILYRRKPGVYWRSKPRVVWLGEGYLCPYRRIISSYCPFWAGEWVASLERRVHLAVTWPRIKFMSLSCNCLQYSESGESLWWRKRVRGCKRAKLIVLVLKGYQHGSGDSFSL